MQWSRNTKLYVLFLSIALTGCASTVPSTTKYQSEARPSSEMAKVVIYRVANEMYAPSMPARIYVDNEKITTLHRNAYTTLCLKPGTHTLGSLLQDALIYSDALIKKWTGNFEGGKIYFYIVQAEVSHAPLLPMGRTQAEAQLIDTNLNTEHLENAQALVPCATSIEPAQKTMPAVKPVVKHITFVADGLFEFDKSNANNILPKGQSELNKFVADTQGLKIEAVTVTGYTDQLGSDAYNNQLSQARADTVLNYLRERGFRAASMRAEGKGKNQPVVALEDCKNRTGIELANCLQPNRRVVIAYAITE